MYEENPRNVSLSSSVLSNDIEWITMDILEGRFAKLFLCIKKNEEVPS